MQTYPHTFPNYSRPHLNEDKQITGLLGNSNIFTFIMGATDSSKLGRVESESIFLKLYLSVNIEFLRYYEKIKKSIDNQ
jgi:hypothetical protein